MKANKVLSVASEIFPLIKTGGLADVVGALPDAMASQGITMRTLVPGYPAVLAATDDWQTIATLDDFYGSGARLLLGSHRKSGLFLYALDAPQLFDRPGNPYVGPDGVDWPDNHKRFGCLAYMAAEIGRGLDPDWSPDLIHGHDWQTGLMPLYVRELCPGVATVFTIHNIAFQGTFPASWAGALRLPPQEFTVDGYEYHGQIGMLKAGLYYSDKLTTVSPTYARETQSAEFGMGMQGLLASRRLDYGGIVNGIDTNIWNPADDAALSASYTSQSLDRRAANKAQVQHRFGLKVDPERLLFCIISRLTEQKGMDLVLASLDRLVESGGQLALIGTGSPAFEQGFIAASRTYAGHVGCIIGYDETVSHQLQGGSDAILIPSRFEPCGLTQLYGLRYGCVPVVARVGGLADTIVDANDSALQDGVATGVQLSAVTLEGILTGIERCVEIYRQPALWRTMQQRGMGRQLDWRRAAAGYVNVYKRALQGRATP